MVASTHWIHSVDLPVCVLDKDELPITINAAFFELPIDVSRLTIPIEQIRAENSSYFSSCYHFLLDLTQSGLGIGTAWFVIPAEEFASILKTRGIALTNAEYAVLLKFLSGLSLKESAQLDGTSYDTKRDQFKSIMKKLGVRKNFEVAIAVKDAVHSRIIAGLVETSVRSAKTDETFPGEDLVAKHYSSSVRLLSLDIGNEADFLLYDVGPAGGQPVVFFHTVFQPLYPLPHCLPLLYQKDLRLLVPIRPGYCGTVAKNVGTLDSVQNFAANLDKALDILDVENISLLSILHGSIWATHYLASTDRKVTKALMASPAIPSLNGEKGASLTSAFGKMIKGHKTLLSQIIKWHLFVIRTPEMVQRVVQSVYSKFPADREHMEYLNAHKFMTPWLSKILDSSVEGIVNDLLLDDLSMIKTLGAIDVPVKIIHGGADFHTPAAKLKAAIKELESDQIEYLALEGEGLLYCFSQPERIIGYLLEMGKD